jgi:hypothetical protein
MPATARHEELPLLRGRAAVITLVALGLLIGSGLPAQAAGPLLASETPAQRIARLRAEAAKVQRTIEQMNNQVEVLVERYNANREALARTLAAQASTSAR